MIAIFSLVVLGLTCVWGCDYEPAELHTMCIYKEGPACNFTSNSLTQADKDEIVAVHNELRNKVATGNQAKEPSAANMKQLSWDPELATIAQRWVNQCKKGHDKNRGTRTYTWVGQNYAMSGSSAPVEHPDLRKLVSKWYNKEVGNMQPGYVKVFPESTPKVIGHYTQVVWAETEKVGCGILNFKDGKWYTTHLVCNYGPGGNIQGEKMYEEGKACSQCGPEGCSTKYSGLCL